MVDTYVDPDIPYPDAKTASALAIGGPVKYEVLKGSGVDDCWLVENVLLETFKLCKKAVVTLSKALLWDATPDDDGVAVERRPLHMMTTTLLPLLRVSIGGGAGIRLRCRRSSPSSCCYKNKIFCLP